MKVEILDSKVIGKSKQWFLGRISLLEYLNGIKLGHFVYDVQRGVVKNQYLDKILISVENHEPIPPITITTVDKRQPKDSVLEVTDFNILDGLQRTYRLFVYYWISKNGVNEDGSIKSLQEVAGKINKEGLNENNIIPYQNLKNLLDANNALNVTNLADVFSNFSIYLYIWKGLNDKEIINKMLTLNAGQKRVTSTHQYELVFLHLYNKLGDDYKESLVRTKDQRYAGAKRGLRNIGEFMFSSAIIGLQSLIERKPLRVEEGRLYKEALDSQMDEDEYDNEFYNISEQNYLNVGLFQLYIDQLVKLDNALCRVDEEAYKKWFAKDTTMAGIMAAVGYSISGSSFKIALPKKIDALLDALQRFGFFKLNEFEKQYNSLSSTRINIGNKVRLAIFNYTVALLEGLPTTWDAAFKCAMSKKKPNVWDNQSLWSNSALWND